MQKISFVFSIAGLLAAATSTDAAQLDSHLRVIDELPACVARLNCAYDIGNSVDGLTIMRVSTKGALKFLLGTDGIDANRRRGMRDMAAEAAKDLQFNRMNAGETVWARTERCRDLVYEVEDGLSTCGPSLGFICTIMKPHQQERQSATPDPR